MRTSQDDHPVPDAAYAYPVQAAIASGRLGALDSTEALAMPGVLAVLGGVTTLPFGRKDFDHARFTSSEVACRGQLVGVVYHATGHRIRDLPITPAKPLNPA